jgi:hypothetical protein
MNKFGSDSEEKTKNLSVSFPADLFLIVSAALQWAVCADLFKVLSNCSIETTAELFIDLIN